MRALIIGGGIGGLAAAVALRRVGIEPVVFEKAFQVAEVGAGLSLWSNAMIALRRLGLEAPVLAGGSVVDRTRTFFSNGRPAGDFDFTALAVKAGAPTICIHRAVLQDILLDAAGRRGGNVVRTGRECVGVEQDAAGVAARFADGSREPGDLVIGADGIHSAVRSGLFGAEAVRFAGYMAWRGIARGAGELLPERESVAIVARGSHAGCFHCGGGNLYWFVARNAAAGSHPGPGGNKAELFAHIGNWRVPFRQFVDATAEDAIVRNDVVDRPPRPSWGLGRVTLLGDAIHATTPNLGQGACQALEDAVVLADALRRAGGIEAGLRDYEARRERRARFVIEQSWRLGRLVQMGNPVGAWLRDKLMPTRFARRQSEALFERLLCAELPELPL